MRNIRTILWISVLFFLIPQGSYAAAKQTTLICKLTDCPVDSLSLFNFTGLTYKRSYVAKKDKNGSFVFKVPQNNPPVSFYLGFDENSLKPILLGSESEVLVEGSFTNLKAATVKSVEFVQMNATLNRINSDKAEFGNYITQMRAAYGDTAASAEIQKNMKALDARRVAFLDSLGKKNVFLQKLATLHTYLSYQPSNPKYNDELNYFINEYFGLVDFKDPVYNNIPQVFDQFSDFVQNLTSIGLPEEMQKSALDNYLSKMVPGSQCHRYALGGIVTRLIGSNKANNFVLFAEEYLKYYKKDEQAGMVQMLQSKIVSMKGLMMGGDAPEITLNTPEGTSLSLSSYKGKVTLIDFWASWCGPCRRENPHVVELYQKYKNKGFDILGVSLDSNKDAWVAAIAKDGLQWKHVSDLGGWGSSAAKLYGVTSIPQTFLLDKNGKIMAKNLRGEQLTNKLKEIFGE